MKRIAAAERHQNVATAEGRGKDLSWKTYFAGCALSRLHSQPLIFLNRHRGGGHPPTPATPPCVRVRTRRFELVALTPIDQRRKSKRFEVGVGKPHREGFGPSEVPRAASATSRVTSQSRTNPQFQQCRSATARCFPLPPQSCTQSQPDPTGQV